MLGVKLKECTEDPFTMQEPENVIVNAPEMVPLGVEDVRLAGLRVLSESLENSRPVGKEPVAAMSEEFEIGA
ncbi:MAG: hypothetical protein NZ953_04625 [Thaumarchaeota archaeon]|nr:hypothetical protein [Candidatus Calditenuaceae archaeon]MDW8041342.1 hypothetical protein [Nitrososphaerota archaeon]